MRKVPKLRFKEFSDELNNYHFIDIGKVKIGLTHTPKYVEKGIPFLSSKNISKGYIDFDEVQYISKEEFESMPKSTKPQKGDILFTRVGSNLGNPIVLEEEKEFGIFVSLGAIKVNKNFNNFYIKYWIDTNYFWKQVEMKVAGGAKNNLNTTWLNEFKLSTPSLQEQEKIANFLSSVDKKISLTEEKLELFREYKKGVMQKIFSQELRFKDNNGNDYPEWEEKRLGEIGDTYNGLTGKSAEDFGRGKKYITYKNIYDNTKINMNILELVNIELGEKQNKVEYGDIFFTTSSETPNEVGYSSVLLDKIQEDIYLNSFCFGFRLKNKVKYLPEFFRYLLRSKNFRTFIYILAQGSTRFNLSKIELLKLKVLLPSLEEQQKIADFLSSIDSKIESIEKELEGLKEFKKGLLQQMFV